MFSLRSLSFSGLGDPFAGLSSYFACAVLVFVFVLRKLKKSQMQVLDSLFWLLFSVSFVILGVFPQVAMWLSSLFGFMSASNFVFLYVIAVLVVRDFCNSLRLSRQEERLNSLVQAVALSREKEKEAMRFALAYKSSRCECPYLYYFQQL